MVWTYRCDHEVGVDHDVLGLVEDNEELHVDELVFVHVDVAVGVAFVTVIKLSVVGEHPRINDDMQIVMPGPFKLGIVDVPEVEEDNRMIVCWVVASVMLVEVMEDVDVDQVDEVKEEEVVELDDMEYEVVGYCCRGVETTQRCALRHLQVSAVAP
eukprot:1375610-Amphidinium_carterae.2